MNIDQEIAAAKIRIYEKIDRTAAIYCYSRLGGPDYLTPIERFRIDYFAYKHGGFKIEILQDLIFISGGA